MFDLQKLINKIKKYCCYISYDGLLDPLGNSQILPYLEGLSESGFKLIVLSFEKTDRKKILIEKLNNRLKSKDIKWIYLPFKKQFFGYFRRILKSYYLLKKTSRNKKIILFHTRGILTALVYLISRLKCPLIYDIRAFSGEYIDCKRLSSNSIFAYVLMIFEKIIINISSGIVVLDESGLLFLKQNFKRLKAEVKVIPTCTDIKKFPILDKVSDGRIVNDYRFVFLGGARFPYRPDLAIIFIKRLLENNINCKIDFINERDQDYIKKLCKDFNLSSKNYNIFSLPQKEVSTHLIKYQSGLIFNTSGRWRKMSCPTKLAEYLAAGLHIISLSGIEAINRLSKKQPNSFEVLEEINFKENLTEKKIGEIIKNISDPCVSTNARKLANNYFDISIANRQYSELYKKLLKK